MKESSRDETDLTFTISGKDKKFTQIIKSEGRPMYKWENNTKGILKKMCMRCALHSSGLR